MPASRPILPLAEDLDSHDALLVREAANERRRRRRRWLLVLGSLVLAAGVGFGARPALHVVKEWQARRLARDAVRLTEEGNFEAARTKVQDALAIWQLEPDAMHAAAFFLTRASLYRQALPYWQRLETVRPLTACRPARLCHHRDQPRRYRRGRDVAAPRLAGGRAGYMA